MPAGEPAAEIRLRLDALYPGRWALGLIRLCAPSIAHTHRDRDGVDRECDARGKRPLDTGWQTAAAERYAAGTGRDAHLAAIARHVASGGNVGLALPEGAAALDADTDDAAAWLDTALPGAPAQRTARGLHELVSAPAGARNGVRVPIADRVEIDVRAAGGQIVVEPSMHATGAAYTWLRALPLTRAELPVCPVPLPTSDARGAQVSRRADGESIAEGARNATLMSLAGSMRRRGMGGDAIHAALAAENTTRCSPPLPDAEVRRIAESVARYAPTAPASIDREPARWRRAQTTCLADVRPEHVEWLWPGRIPRGAVTILDGDPDLGKSTVTLDIGARVSRGRAMPDDAAGIAAADVIVMTYEDHLAATIRPRLDAADADVSRVHAIAIATEHGPDMPSLPQDLDALGDAIRDTGAALVIVDPLMAALSGSVDAHRDQDVRRVLAPLARIAEQHGCAVLAVRHLRKSGGANPLYAGGGSIGIIGAARSALLVAVDPQNPARRVLARAKCNLAAPVPSIGYRLVPAGGTVAVDWLGAVEHTAGELLLAAAQGDDERSARDLAAELLRAELAAGPQPVQSIQRAARRAGIADRTLQRAAADLGLRPQRQGFGPGGEYVYPMLATPAGGHGGGGHDDHGQPPADVGNPAPDREASDHARQGSLLDEHGAAGSGGPAGDLW